MADHFLATSEDGVQFKLNRDGSWAPHLTSVINDNACFRSSNWGDTLAKVKRSEKEHLHSEAENILMYQTSIDGFSTNLYFFFVNGFLNNADYVFEQKKWGLDCESIQVFERLRRVLNHQYYDSTKITNTWRGDPNIGNHINQDGSSYMSCIWETERENITLKLTADNWKHALRLSHQCGKAETTALF